VTVKQPKNLFYEAWQNATNSSILFTTTTILTSLDGGMETWTYVRYVISPYAAIAFITTNVVKLQKRAIRWNHCACSQQMLQDLNIKQQMRQVHKRMRVSDQEAAYRMLELPFHVKLQMKLYSFQFK